MRPLLPILIASATLALAPAGAPAKGVTDAQVCGADGCTKVDDRSLHAVLAEGDPTTPPAVAAPFVEVRATAAHGGPDGAPSPLRFTYVPSLGVMRSADSGGWIRLFDARRAELDEVVAGVTPRPASQLAGVARPARAGAAADAGAGPAWWPFAIALAVLVLALALRRLRPARDLRDAVRQ